MDESVFKNWPVAVSDPEEWIKAHPDAERWWNHDPASNLLLLWYIDKATGQMLLYKNYTVTDKE